MTAALILWSHALAALTFAATALAQWRGPGQRRFKIAFVAALMLSSLWALAVAGTGTGDLGTRVVEASRDLAWLGFAFGLARRYRASGWTLAAVYLVVAGVVMAAAGLAIVESVTKLPAARSELMGARLMFRIMAAVGALVLAQHLQAVAPARGGMRGIALALATMWSGDLLLFGIAYAGAASGGTLVAARGLATAAAALILGLAAQRRDGSALSLSRTAAMRALTGVALVMYLGVVAFAVAVAGAWHGEGARALQAAVVIGAATVLLTLLSGSWLRAWTKVKVAKHLFGHRYDYRVEWQRFSDTLGAGGEPLEARVVAAIARPLDAPAGLLLVPDGSLLRAEAGWRCETRGEIGSASLVALLATGRIIELDAARAGQAPADAAALPPALLDRADAWIVVPLLHGEALAGAVLLSQPPVARALDWEDFDLLRVAGRQAASYLAEDRAGRALAQAERFDEFNRRFAFILHDIKNLVSQQLLVARNVERHAANPEFRADMVATLKDSADRMTTLLARLTRAEPAAAEPLSAIDCAALVERVARRSQHAVACDAAPLWVTAHPQRLEQVLAQLVQNAAEAGAAGEPVTLRVLAADAGVVIEVADRGCGMSPVFMRDELFRPFSSTKAHGFGIGAFEARQLVTGMGGGLEVESREGEGSCFRVILPAATALEKVA